MTIKLGLVGEEILHSKMPRLQEYLGQLSGIDIKYDLLDSSQIDNFDPIKEIQASIINGYSGLNVTHPFKQHVVTIVNEPYISPLILPSFIKLDKLNGITISSLSLTLCSSEKFEFKVII